MTQTQLLTNLNRQTARQKHSLATTTTQKLQRDRLNTVIWRRSPQHPNEQNRTRLRHKTPGHKHTQNVQLTVCGGVNEVAEEDAVNGGLEHAHEERRHHERQDEQHLQHTKRETRVNERKTTGEQEELPTRRNNMKTETQDRGRTRITIQRKLEL